MMLLVMIVLAAWVALSLPLGVVAGRAIRTGSTNSPERNLETAHVDDDLLLVA